MGGRILELKHCPKSSEPPSLADYRNANPNDNWDQFKDTDRAAYDQVVDLLRQDQSYLCAYCEMVVSQTNTQVGHFHPKSDAARPPNWNLDWQNLWLCCKGGTQTWLAGPGEYLPPLPANRSCDEAKENRILDTKILRPDQVPPFPRIVRYEQSPGSVQIIAERKGNIPTLTRRRARGTIKELNLNCTRLCAARTNVLSQLEKDIRDAREQGVRNLAQSHIPAKWLSKTSDGRYRRFFTLIRWRLGQAAEDYLTSVGYAG